MTTPAKALLKIFWQGEEIPGVTFYGLRPRHGGPPPDFPSGKWSGSVRVRASELYGDAWEVLVWDVSVPEWPDPGSFRELVRSTFDALMEVGCVVAWIGLEGYFADPPELLKPETMSQGVLAALSDATGFVCPLDIDQPMQWLDDAELVALRDASHGLAASS